MLQVADCKDLLLSVIWVTLLPCWVMIDMPTRKIRLLVRRLDSEQHIDEDAVILPAY